SAGLRARGDRHGAALRRQGGHRAGLHSGTGNRAVRQPAGAPGRGRVAAGAPGGTGGHRRAGPGSRARRAHLAAPAGDAARNGAPMRVSGFSIVRNAELLDFPVEASIRSILPICYEVVVNVGRSEDRTLELVRAIGDPKLRILETEWELERGEAQLRTETL